MFYSITTVKISKHIVAKTLPRETVKVSDEKQKQLVINALRGATPEIAVTPFQGWSPAGCIEVGHGGPWRYFRESMETQ
jgi:hypothetical protein